MTPNQTAFLDMLAFSEIGTALLNVSDDGYDVLVGSTASHPLLMTSYADHPNILNTKFNSTAAGRYQILHRYWDYYKKLLNLPDFTPASQDAAALQYIKECHALDDIESGNFENAVLKCAHIWASLPSSPYGQHTNPMADLKTAYINAGGTVA